MKQIYIAVAIIIAAAIGVVVFAMTYVSQQPDLMMEKTPTEDAMMSDDKMGSEVEGMMKDEGEIDGAMMQKDDDTSMTGDDKMMKDEAMMEKYGSYKDYSPETVSAEQAAGNKVVLFFHAPWCPFCKTANTAFETRVKDIPAGVTVLKTDYDSSTELKRQYGVTYQHTFVQIDTDQKMVTKWNGGDIDMLKKQLK